MITCTDPIPDHNNGTGTAAIEAAQDDPIQHTGNTGTGYALIHHMGDTANPPHTTAHQATPLRITVDHIHDLPTDCQNVMHTKRIMQFEIILQPRKPKVSLQEE